MKTYRDFQIKRITDHKFPFQVWYGLQLVSEERTEREARDYINLVHWARQNIPF